MVIDGAVQCKRKVFFPLIRMDHFLAATHADLQNNHRARQQFLQQQHENEMVLKVCLWLIYLKEVLITLNYDTI